MSAFQCALSALGFFCLVLLAPFKEPSGSTLSWKENQTTFHAHKDSVHRLSVSTEPGCLALRRDIVWHLLAAFIPKETWVKWNSRVQCLNLFSKLINSLISLSLPAALSMQGGVSTCPLTHLFPYVKCNFFPENCPTWWTVWSWLEDLIGHGAQKGVWAVATESCTPWIVVILCVKEAYLGVTKEEEIEHNFLVFSVPQSTLWTRYLIVIKQKWKPLCPFISNLFLILRLIVCLKEKGTKGNNTLGCVLASTVNISWAIFLNRHIITYVSLSSSHPRYQEEEIKILAIPSDCPNFGRNSRKEAVCTLKSDGKMTFLFIKANHFPALSLANPLSVIIKSVHTT